MYAGGAPLCAPVFDWTGFPPFRHRFVMPPPLLWEAKRRLFDKIYKKGDEKLWNKAY